VAVSQALTRVAKTPSTEQCREDPHMLHTRTSQPSKDSVRVGVLGLDGATEQQIPICWIPSLLWTAAKDDHGDQLRLITHHPTLFTAVLGFQQAWDMLPLGIAFSISVPPT
jgi:hypothetical protein